MPRLQGTILESALVEAERLEAGAQTWIVTDADDAALAHGHDRPVASDRERSSRLHGAVVVQVLLHARGAEGHEDVLPVADAAFQLDAIGVRVARGQDRPYFVELCRRLLGSDR